MGRVKVREMSGVLSVLFESVKSSRGREVRWGMVEL